MSESVVGSTDSTLGSETGGASVIAGSCRELMELESTPQATRSMAPMQRIQSIRRMYSAFRVGGCQLGTRAAAQLPGPGSGSQSSIRYCARLNRRSHAVGACSRTACKRFTPPWPATRDYMCQGSISHGLVAVTWLSLRVPGADARTSRQGRPSGTARRGSSCGRCDNTLAGRMSRYSSGELRDSRLMHRDPGDLLRSQCTGRRGNTERRQPELSSDHRGHRVVAYRRVTSRPVRRAPRSHR